MSEYLLIFELGVLAIVFYFQWFFYRYTKSNIHTLQSVFAELPRLQVRPVNLDRDIIKNKNAKELVKELRNAFQNDHTDENISELTNHDPDANSSVFLIFCKKSSHPILTKILDSLNIYLIKNSGSAADFNLISDIVERNYDTIDEKISVTAAAPLYLGLVGTIIGIIIGLVLMPKFDAEVDKQTFLGINHLIRGVSAAMVASLLGLALTVKNSAWNYRNAKEISQNQKNDFYLFIQMELMPLLSQSVNTNVFTLNQNIARFNQHFSENILMLSEQIDKNHQTIELQQETIHKIDSINPKKVTEVNLRLFESLSQGLEQLDRFSEYLNTVNTNAVLLDSAGKNLSAFADRTVAIEDIASVIRNSLDENHKLQQYLGRIFADLDIHKDIAIQSVGGVQASLEDTIAEFGNSIKESISFMQNGLREMMLELDRSTESLVTNIGGTIETNLKGISTKSTDVLASYHQNLKKITEDLNALFIDANKTFSKGNRDLIEAIIEQMDKFEITLEKQTGRINSILEHQPITVENYQVLLKDVKHYVENSNRVNETLSKKVSDLNTFNEEVVNVLYRIENSQYPIRNFFNRIIRFIKRIFKRK
jgi:ABC-type transporter Mla subunit MlaD